MKIFPLDLNSLAPRESTFKLSTFPERSFTLRKWSLRVRAWALDKWGAAKVKEIFEQQQIVPISEMAFFMLKEPTDFKTLEDFQEAVVTIADQVSLIKAMLETLGIGEPEIEKISKDIDEKAKAMGPQGGNPDPNSRRPKKKK